jgi:hypothetical protein
MTVMSIQRSFTAPSESAQTTDSEIGCSCSTAVIESFRYQPDIVNGLEPNKYSVGYFPYRHPRPRSSNLATQSHIFKQQANKCCRIKLSKCLAIISAISVFPVLCCDCSGNSICCESGNRPLCCLSVIIE